MDTFETLAREMLAWNRTAFEDDEHVDGGDMVEAFAQWRERLAAIANQAPEPGALAWALNVADEGLDEDEADQQSGLDEGIYEDEESAEIFARIEGNRVTMAAARAEFARLTEIANAALAVVDADGSPETALGELRTVLDRHFPDNTQEA